MVCLMTPAVAPDVPHGTVHVWSARLDRLPSVEDLEYLSRDERTRAGRFAFGADRLRYLAARVVLRRLLACYLDVAPGGIDFDYEENGKPVLGVGVDRDFHFNVSHSRDLLVIAIGRGFPLGIDIETTRALPDRDAVARSYFSRIEYDRLVALPSHRRDVAFFECWTRKEAFVKAIGDGLTYPLDRFEVTFGTDDQACFVHISGDRAEASRWALIDLKIAPGTTGALAIRSLAPRVECREVDELLIGLADRK